MHLFRQLLQLGHFRPGQDDFDGIAGSGLAGFRHHEQVGAGNIGVEIGLKFFTQIVGQFVTCCIAVSTFYESSGEADEIFRRRRLQRCGNRTAGKRTFAAHQLDKIGEVGFFEKQLANFVGNPLRRFELRRGGKLDVDAEVFAIGLGVEH